MDKDTLNRRDFFKTAGAGVAAATVLMTPRDAARAQAAARRLRSIASPATRTRSGRCSSSGREPRRRRDGPGGAAAGARGAPSAREPAARAAAGGGRGRRRPRRRCRHRAAQSSNPNAAKPLAVARGGDRGARQPASTPSR